MPLKKMRLTAEKCNEKKKRSNKNAFTTKNFFFLQDNGNKKIKTAYDNRRQRIIANSTNVGGGRQQHFRDMRGVIEM